MYYKRILALALLTFYSSEAFTSTESAFQDFLTQVTLIQKKSKDNFADWQSVEVSLESEPVAQALVLIKIQMGQSICYGTGFFLADDFPIMHTASHVLQECYGQLEIGFFDPRAWFFKRDSFEVKDYQLIDSSGDHVRVALSGIEDKIRKYITPLRRASHRPHLGEAISSFGYTKHGQGLDKAQGVASACINFDSFVSDNKPKAIFSLKGFHETVGEYYLSKEALQSPVPTLGEMNYEKNLESVADQTLMYHRNLYCGLTIIQQGMSGGPVMNSAGEVVGTNSGITHIVSYFTDITQTEISAQ